MIRHFITVAIRNLAKYKTQTVISISSIGVSVAVFALISAVMLNINGDSLLKQDYAEDAAIMYILDEDGDGVSFKDIDLSNFKGRQFRTVEKIYLPDREKRSVTVINEITDALPANILRVDPEFLQWGGYRSAISNEIVKPIGEEEVVLSRNFGDRLFGDYRSAYGKQIRIQYIEDGVSEIRSYRIADVASPFSMNDSKLPKDIGIFHSDNFGGEHHGDKVYLQLRPGADLENVAEEMSTYLNVGAGDLNIFKYEVWVGKSNIAAVIISRAVMLFLYLFVIVSLSSALRQWLQLFRMRQREIGIRKSVGGKNRNLLAMFLTEELVSILSAFLLTIICCLLAYSFIKNDFRQALDSIDLDMAKIFILTVVCYLSVIVVCLISGWYVIRRISPERSSVALQMRPKKHRLRNIGITLQMVICIIFLSVAIVFAVGFGHIERQLGIPSDTSRYENGFVVKAEGITSSQFHRIDEGLRQIGSVASMMNVDRRGMTIEYADTTKENAKANIQSDNEVVEFYDLKVSYRESRKSLRRYVIVSGEIRDKMLSTGEWSGGRIMIDGSPYEVAGWYDRIPFQGESAIIMADPQRKSDTSCHFYILPVKGMEREAKEEIRSLIELTMPDRLDAYPKDLSFELLGEYKSIIAIRAVIYILLAISLITTVATIHAAVSLDTRRRRKEMALRKISGAKPGDIRRIFAKSYVVIIGISILIGVPISWIIIITLNETFGFDVSPLLATIVSVAVCVGAVFMTLYWKILEVMKVDPVAFLKD